LPPARLAEVRATIEVVVAPAVPKLYFWALQVGFSGGGAAHTGLQWLPAPGGARPAVNWGGYRASGSELDGSVSDLPSLDGNPNTRLFDWRAGRPHRLRVFAAPGGRGWRATIDDVVIRDLYAPGDSLTSPMVWSEVFAACDDPSVVIRWTELGATTTDGRTLEPDAVTTTYQAHVDGGCDNTDIRVDETGICQITAVERATPAGAVLQIPH
jgi:hypothetical protein